MVILPSLPSLCLSDFLLCYELMFFDVGVLINGEKMSSTIEDAGHQNWKQKLYYITLCLQVKLM